MVTLSLPDFQPMRDNISFNNEVDVTRGIHAKPQDKFVSVAADRVLGAQVDLREGPPFGIIYTVITDPGIAVFIPRDVGNSYQTLEPNTAYTYLVNDHWSPDMRYTFLSLADETAAMDWLIPLERTILSDRDKAHPRITSVTPFPASAPLGRHAFVTGASGQLGRELMRALSEAGFTVTGMNLPEVLISDAERVAALPWDDIDVMINVVAQTNVDGAETPEGRRVTWQTSPTGPTILARKTTTHGTTMVHISTRYAFDGAQGVHIEDGAPSPLGTCGQSKAGGDAAVASTPKHYIVRTSWVVGDDENFLKTMVSLADQGTSPSVVSNQVGRLTFASDLARGIIYLLTSDVPFGTYNLSGEEPVMSWAQIARRMFELYGRNPEDVIEVATEEYFAGREVTPRPLSSILSLTKIKAADFTPEDSSQRIDSYVASLRD